MYSGNLIPAGGKKNKLEIKEKGLELKKKKTKKTKDFSLCLSLINCQIKLCWCSSNNDNVTHVYILPLSKYIVYHPFNFMYVNA